MLAPWDGGAKFTCLVAKLPTGIVHPSYGMVTAECQNTAYREAEQTFLFQYKWTVSAGSFGSGIDSFEVTEWKLFQSNRKYRLYILS